MTTTTRLPDVVALDAATRDYAWGSPTTIPELLGEEPTGAPVAELWIGAHPGAPSQWADHPQRVGLDALVAGDPVGLLGAAVAERFGERLPFLLKLLAAEQALSLQVHPDLAQARAGWDRENAAGVPLAAAHRNYRDDNHKPEMLVALTPFDALCGFRDRDDTLDLLDRLGVAELAPLRAAVAAGPDLRAAVQLLLALPAPEAAAWVAAAAAGAGRLVDREPAGRWTTEARWTVRLADQSPAEIGPVVALLLHLVRLQPGEALFLAAGQIHSYLSGFGVELLANSDNVLRCGLTPKHVDAAELLEVTVFAPGDGGVRAAVAAGPGATRYPVPVGDFALTRHEVGAPGAPERAELADPGPQLLLLTRGELTVRGADDSAVTLRPGRAVFVPAGRPVVATGHGTLFRATTGEI